MAEGRRDGRVGRLREKVKELGWRAAFLSPGDDLRYVAGFTPTPDERPAYLVVTAERAGFLLPALNRAQAETETDLPIVSYGDDEAPAGALRRLCAELGVDASGVFGVGDTTRADFLLLLQSVLPEAQWQPASLAVSPLRMVKDAEEIARLERVARVTDRVVEAGLGALSPGRTEREVAHAIRDAFLREGAEEILFLGVASGPNTAFPHHHTSDRRLEAGDAVWLDIGCRIDGYASDITRMAIVGPGPDGYAEIHAIVARAVEAAFQAARPGAPLAEVDRAARRVIEEAGYGEAFVHRTGHGLGLSGHELPSVHGKNETPIEPGMVFTIEPGVYLPGRFGVRIEDVAVVGPDGARRLSRLSRDAFRVPASPGGSEAARAGRRL